MAKITFNEFKDKWLQEAEINKELSTIEIGRRFALNLLTDYLEILEDEDEFIYQLDGSGDGGIDIAYLKKGEVDESGELLEDIGDTWYVVQSKYGSAYKGSQTLRKESEKIFNTLEGHSTNLSHQTSCVLEQIKTFQSKIRKNDELILVFATSYDLNDSDQQHILARIEDEGKQRFGNYFRVINYSLTGLYNKLYGRETPLKILLKAKLTNPNPTQGNILTGSIKLPELFDFLDRYFRNSGRDLDRIFDKNIRRYLGNKVGVNKSMENTLRNEYQNFGLYNNGITIVVNQWRRPKEGDKEAYTLTNPSIVNGCQTVSTIWEVLSSENKTDVNWRIKYENTFILAKIATVDETQDELLKNIIQYTNSQNKVEAEDFLGLEKEIVNLKTMFETTYQINLELYRGELKTRAQKQKSGNMFELIKVYGAGWLGKVGEAANQNALFLPQGVIFNKIMNNETGALNINDLYAAFHIWKFAKDNKLILKCTKFIFYRVVIKLLESILLKNEEQLTFTQGLLRLIKNENGAKVLFDQALSLLKEYLEPTNEESCYKEEYMKHKKNLYIFTKSPKLFTESYSKNLLALLNLQKKDMKRTGISTVIEKALSESDDKHTIGILKARTEPSTVVEVATPFEYVQQVPDLQNGKLMKEKVLWVDICKQLGITPGKSGRRALQKWVPENRPEWPVPA
jgi:AIPR protein